MDNYRKIFAIVNAIVDRADAKVTIHQTDYGIRLEAKKQIGGRTATISISYDLCYLDGIHDEWVEAIASSEGRRIAYHFEEAQHRGAVAPGEQYEQLDVSTAADIRAGTPKSIDGFPLNGRDELSGLPRRSVGTND